MALASKARTARWSRPASAVKIGKMDGFHAALLVKPLCWEDGYMIPPTAPGLGVELNMDTVLANPWDGDRLHLEMTPDPYDTHLHRHFAGG